MFDVKITVLGYCNIQADTDSSNFDMTDVQEDACIILDQVDFKELKNVYGEFIALKDGNVMSFRISGTYTVHEKTDITDEAVEIAENKFYHANFGPLVKRELQDMAVYDSKGRVVASEEF